MLNTKTYRKLFRQLAKEHDVKLLEGTWTDGADGSGHKIVSRNRKVTFTVNSDSKGFNDFITDLTINTKLMQGSAPRFTKPKPHITYIFDNGWRKQQDDFKFAYVKFNTRIG